MTVQLKIYTDAYTE